MAKRHHIEQYQVGDKTIYVKREDLWAGDRYARNAKLRGIRAHLQTLLRDGYDRVAVFDSRISRGGWGVAELAKEVGIACVIYYPVLKKDWDGPMGYNQQQAASFGAEIHKMQASKLYPMWYKVRRILRDESRTYLYPLGLRIPEAVANVAAEVGRVPSHYFRGSLVCVVGTGTMFAGWIRGLALHHERWPDIYGVSMGMTRKELKGESRTNVDKLIRSRIAEMLPGDTVYPDYEMVTTQLQYYDADDYPCPFNADAWYDLKAWRWLCENIDKLREPLFFVNIG